MTRRGALRLAKDAAKRVLPRPVIDFLKRPRGRFGRLKREADGMLSPALYRRIYEECRRLPAGDVVEVGGAGGAASIAIAWGLRDAGHDSRVVVVEKCRGGSRDAYGGFSDNLSRLVGNLRRFGAYDRVSLYTESLSLENGHEVLELVRTPQLSALFLDADGRLHRDFALFWPHLREGGLIVVDDYSAEGGRKHAMTYHLLNRLIEQGLFEPIELVGITYFGRKPAGARLDGFDLEVLDALCTRVREEHDAAAAPAPGSAPLPQ